MRHRRPAQRRQVHPLQRPDQGRHRGRELSVLHDRAERRHRRAARPAPRTAGGDRQARDASCRRSSSSSTSPAWSPARPRAKAWATSSSPHIRETDAIVNVVRCFEDDNVIHVAGKVDPVADIEVIQTELCLADLATRREERSTALNKVAKRRQRQGAPSGSSTCSRSCSAALDEAQPVRSARLQQGRAGDAQAALPDHRQAGDVRRQRRRERLREQPAPRPPARVRRQAERAGGGDLRQDRGRAGRHGRRRQARCSWPRWARPSRAWRA